MTNLYAKEALTIMEIIQFKCGDQLPQIPNLILCLGFFDGVHLGHQTLINNAKKEGYKLGILSFSQSPAFVVGNKLVDNCITSISDKVDIFEEMGVDYFFVMDFDRETLGVTKDEFIDNVLLKINPYRICCGSDFHFGARAEGDVDYLKRFFNVKVENFRNIEAKKISSRDIIAKIKEGEMEQVEDMLGRPYRINGTVMVGFKNGSKIDFPTANMKLEYEYVYPKTGVYVGYGYVYGEKYKVIINVGVHPTINPLAKPEIEVHFLDFNDNLYGKNIFVEFKKFIREEKKFESLDELKVQLTKDRIKAKKVLQ